MTNIRYLKRSEIDADKWDRCIQQATNGLIYAQTWYLDALCDNWDGLVLGTYDAVMPIPWRSKWGIRYVYTPYFVPVLGIFSAEANSSFAPDFFHEVAKRFRYCNLDVESIYKPTPPGIWQLLERVNYIIAPAKAKYSRLARRKLAEASSQKIEIETGINPAEVIQAYQQNYRETHAMIRGSSYNQLIAACKKAPENHIITLAAHLPNERMAGFYLLLADDRNFYSLMGGSTKAGKNAGAFYALTDAAIQQAALAGKLFRFEGSDKPGIAFFNQQFGPEKRIYQQLRLNRLPWPLRVLKK